LERNIPTYFASLLLLISSALFFLVWKSTKTTERYRYVWLLLSIVFCVLSVDEFATLHELLIRPVRDSLGTTGIFYFAWVIPYGIAVLLLAILVLPAFLRLERRFIALFFSSAAIYLGGALGVEMLGASYAEKTAVADLTYRAYQTVEESLEFVGLLILVYTLMSLLQARVDGFTVIVAGKRSRMQ
jgi:hypothetical protein